MGDYVKKPMRDCTGAEILKELLHQLHWEEMCIRDSRLPVVMVRGGEDSLAVRRETYENLVRNDV